MTKEHSHKATLLFLNVLTLLFVTGITAQAQFRIAPVRSIGKTITCHVGSNKYQLRPDQSLIAPISFAPNNVETQKIFNKITPYTRLTSNIYTIPVTDEEVNVEICPGDVNYIAYNATWLEALYKETNNRWALYAIIAHEIGHYVLNHDRTKTGSDPDIELEADAYAGEVLAKMGISLSDAQAAYHSKLMKSDGGHSHPPIAKRLAAVEKGWRKIRTTSASARESSEANSSESVSYIRKGPVELKNSVYKGGLDNKFEYRFKMTTVQFNSENNLYEAVLKIVGKSGTHKWDNQMYYWAKGSKEDRLLLAWSNRTTKTFGWVVVENYNNRWYCRTARGEWEAIAEGEKKKLMWDDSGQTVEIVLYAPNISNIWSTEEIQYSFGP